MSIAAGIEGATMQSALPSNDSGRPAERIRVAFIGLGAAAAMPLGYR